MDIWDDQDELWDRQHIQGIPSSLLLTVWLNILSISISYKRNKLI